MKKPLLIISTDWHIKPSNIESIIDLIKQKIELAKKLKCNTLVCLGDVFQSRQAQPLSVLECFGIILDLIHEAKMKLYCIPGNHDKTDYQSVKSFLDSFKYHPALELISIQGEISLDGINIHFLPFFEEKTWMSEFSALLGDHLGLAHGNKLEGKHILMSHQALTGSVNNDGTKVENKIGSAAFKDFFKVFLGHYHNEQKIGKNIYHLPSIQANNFGEDNGKGFTVLYDDGSHELVKSIFLHYETIKVDLDNISKKELNKLMQDNSGSKDNIRFKITGSEEKIKSIKKEEFSILGIDVLCDMKDIEYEGIENLEHVELTKDNIKDEFKDWCDKKEKDYDTGMKYINKKFKE